MSYPIATIADRYGFPVAFVHRADLQAALAGAFGTDAVHLGKEVRSFQQNGAGVKVTTRDGESTSADMLVGADGLRSSVRRELLNDGDPFYLGSTIWRGIAPATGIALRPGTGADWVGPGAEFIAFPLRDNRIYWAGVTKEPHGEAPGPGAHKADLLQRFSDWADPVPALIAATDDAAILRNDMFDRAPARRWSGARVTLVGDAAHPMTPNMGQGACQALDDAVALGRSMAGASDLPAAFDLYERRRLKLANRLVAMSRQSTRGFQMANPFLCGLRDALAGHLPRRLVLSMLDPFLRAES